jgi:hypothetical protein
LNSYDCATLLVSCAYFAFVSKYWFDFYFVTTVWGTIAYIICLVGIPESPTWLLSKGRDADAIKAFNFIARFNFTSNRIPDDAKFAESMTRQNT